MLTMAGPARLALVLLVAVAAGVAAYLASRAWLTADAPVPTPAVESAAAKPAVIPERPNVFRLYEQNVGPLTPLIADHLVRALETWPVEWIEDAVAESVAYNKRSWRYIQRILEGWQSEGREPRERYG